MATAVVSYGTDQEPHEIGSGSPYDHAFYTISKGPSWFDETPIQNGKHRTAPDWMGNVPIIPVKAIFVAHSNIGEAGDEWNGLEPITHQPKFHPVFVESPDAQEVVAVHSGVAPDPSDAL